MRDVWRMIIDLINNASQMLNKLLARIKNLVDTIVNSVFRHIRTTLDELRNLIAAYAGLQAIDQNMARQQFCKLLYACQPALDLVWKFVSPEIFKWFKSPEPFTTPDLSKWGIPQMTFNSKYEVFDYIACRLSLSGMYNDMTSQIINNVTNFMEDYRQYVTVEWYLKNTFLGKLLVRQMKDYEDFFNEYPKKYLAMLEPYVNCTFAGCDFAFSSRNYLEDFKEKYKIGKDNAADPFENWKLYGDEMLSALHTASDGAISDILTIVPENAQKLYDEQQARNAATDYVVQRNNEADKLLDQVNHAPKREMTTKLTKNSVEPK